MKQQFGAFSSHILHIQHHFPSFALLSWIQVSLKAKWARRSCMFGRCRIASVTGAAQTCTLNRCFALTPPPLLAPPSKFPRRFSEDTAEWMNSHPSSMFVPRRRGKTKTKYPCFYFFFFLFPKISFWCEDLVNLELQQHQRNINQRVSQEVGLVLQNKTCREYRLPSLWLKRFYRFLLSIFYICIYLASVKRKNKEMLQHSSK